MAERVEKECVVDEGVRMVEDWDRNWKAWWTRTGRQTCCDKPCHRCQVGVVSS